MGTITVFNLGKAYKQYPNRWSRLLEWMTPGNAKRHKPKWVLQDINFTVNAGEAVGIIGINGGHVVFDGPPERLGEDAIRRIYDGTPIPQKNPSAVYELEMTP
jgi:ABC-type phosphate/phosphonate transport system ATPase subunit